MTKNKNKRAEKFFWSLSAVNREKLHAWVDVFLDLSFRQQDEQVSSLLH